MIKAQGEIVNSLHVPFFQLRQGKCFRIKKTLSNLRQIWKPLNSGTAVIFMQFYAVIQGVFSCFFVIPDSGSAICT